MNNKTIKHFSKNIEDNIVKFHFFVKIIFNINLVILFWLFHFYSFPKEKTNFYFDKYETNIFKEVKNKLIGLKCSIMENKQREFLNGIIRKYKPKKILELGVHQGGSSIIILNAIKDIKDSHLFSVDVNGDEWIGSCVKNNFSFLLDKWTLFKGNIVAKYIENIGKNIELAFIDTSHFEPGEILDFIIILPFLKEEAIIIFHDIDLQILESKGKEKRNEWAPYIIFNIIRGEKFFPSGEGIFNKNIGAIKLEKNQKRFIHDYCRTLGGQWQYFPSEKHIQIVINHFQKYYDYQCQKILNESINFNRRFVRDNPKKDYYSKRENL